MPRKSLADRVSYDVIVVDGMNLISRSYHGMSELSYKGQKTGMLYGTARFYTTYHRKYPEAQIIFLWEGKNSWRKQRYPHYKAKRKKVSYDDNNEFIDCLTRVKDMLPIMGVHQAWCETMEADDLAAYMVDTLQPGQQLLLVSNDDDWYGCLQDGVDILDKKTIKTQDTVRKELGFPGHKIRLYKILKGCSSDDISGVPYFPSKLAVEVVNRSSSVHDFKKVLVEMGETKWAVKVDQFMWALNDNYHLVMPAKIDPGKIEWIEGRYTIDPLRKALLDYGMEKIVGYLDE